LKTWAVQDAKARFSELLEACMHDGPQMVTKRGEERAVLIPVAEWRRLTESKRPSLMELLLTDFARGELNIPPRGTAQRRPNPFIER
jgi:prevent-host-death family protein